MDLPIRPLDELEERATLIEALADGMPGVDPYCSTLDWVVPANHAFAPESEPLIVSEEGTGEGLLARYELPEGGHVVAGLEPMWGFACPLLTADVEAMGDLMVETLGPERDWDWLVLSGMPRNEITAHFGQTLSHLGSVRYGEGITRQIADLADGADGWFQRRSPRFRKQLRAAAKRAEEVGVQLIDVSEHPDVFERCLAVERSSWKGLEGDGITGEHMRSFYEQMVGRLQPRGRLRATIAQLGDHDIGYIFGSLRGGRYRGLQLSYAESARRLSISHLLQHHTIQSLMLEAEPVHTYDLGMDMDYKQRWADRTDTSVVIVVER